MIARCVRILLNITYSLGGLRFLRRIDFALAEDSPLACLERQTGGEVHAILLGNPVQEARRSVALLTDKTGTQLVAKTGVNPAAREAVLREHEFINQWSERFSAMQRSSHFLEDDNWATFTVDFLDGKKVSVENSNEILDVLKGWVSVDHPQPLSSFSRWQEIVSKWSDTNTASDLLDAGDQILIRPSLVHNDFAPWNIIRNHQEVIKVIDWEEGETDGIPGWDWVHFIYQTATLVQRKTVVQTATYIENMLHKTESQEYLKLAGWQGYESWLLETYLAAEQSNDSGFRGEVLEFIHANG
jgi:hypothetical protein